MRDDLMMAKDLAVSYIIVELDAKSVSNLLSAGNYTKHLDRWKCLLRSD